MTNVGARLAHIARRLGRLRGRSAHELATRASQRISVELERRGLSSLGREPSDARFRALLDPEFFTIGDSTGAALREHFARREAPRFFPGVRDGRSAAELRTGRWAPEHAALITAADAVMAGRFDLLGYRALSFGDPVDWHLDPIAGVRAPLRHWSRIDYLDAAVVGDHKVTWELNRHQHFMLLGRAYRVTGDTAYARCFAERLEAWLDANPPKLGINWASSLEIAYRAISWLWAIELFRDADALGPPLLQRALRVLYLHARHLERYLSLYFSPNTHLTGEALGLLYLGVLLPEFRDAERWRTLGWEILVQQVPRQIHDDGVYFEHASHYHRYTADIYLHAMGLAGLAGLPVPGVMRQRLERAMDHLADLTRPDGTIPFIGDDDGGALVSLEERGYADVRAALGIASVMLDRPDYAVVAGAASQEALWMLGPEGAESIRAASGGEPPRHLSRLYAEGGYAIMRDGWGARAHHLVVDSGPLGAMNCGHAHSDALSFELTALGRPALVDPGTFTYTGDPADRDAFRLSSAHNTLTVDGSSASVPAGPFSWTHAAGAVVERWWTGSCTDILVASHDGFLRLPSPVRHRRKILFVRTGFWVVVDSMVTEGAHQAVANFHGAIGSRLMPRGPTSAVLSLPGGTRQERLHFSVHGDVSSVRWEEDWVSPVYGAKVLAPCIRVATQGHSELVTLLVPAAGDEVVTVEELEMAGGRACRIARSSERGVDLLLLGTGQLAAHDAGGLSVAGAELAWVRRVSPGGPLTAVSLCGASARLTVDGITFTTDSAAEFLRHERGWSVEGPGAFHVS